MGNRKDLYKKFLNLIALVGTATILVQGFGDKKYEFKTYKGKRNLKDYEDFLKGKNIDYRNSYVEAEGNMVRIFEKEKGKHLITENNPNSINEIVEMYKMNKEEFLKINNLHDNQPLKIGMELKIYWYKEYDFTLEELDESSKWIYHYVLPGENLEKIAQQYDISEEEIRKNNSEIFNENQIKTYSTIKIHKKHKIKTKELCKK